MILTESSRSSGKSEKNSLIVSVPKARASSSNFQSSITFKKKSTMNQKKITNTRTSSFIFSFLVMLDWKIEQYARAKQKKNNRSFVTFWFLLFEYFWKVSGFCLFYFCHWFAHCLSLAFFFSFIGILFFFFMFFYCHWFAHSLALAFCSFFLQDNAALTCQAQLPTSRSQGRQSQGHPSRGSEWGVQMALMVWGIQMVLIAGVGWLKLFLY